MAKQGVMFGIVIPTPWERVSLIPLLSKAGFSVTGPVHLSSAPWTLHCVRIKSTPVPGNGAIVAVIIDSYVGGRRAAAATEFLINRYSPNVILHAGAAGALDGDLLPGDIVIGTAVRSIATEPVMRDRESLGLPPGLDRFLQHGTPQHRHKLQATPGLVLEAAGISESLCCEWGHWNAPGWPTNMEYRNARVHTGYIGTAADMIRNLPTYDFYVNRFSDSDDSLLCVDMESAGVFECAEAYGITRRLAVRCISDNDRYSPQLLTMQEIGPATAAAASRANAVLAQLMRNIMQDQGRFPQSQGVIS